MCLWEVCYSPSARICISLTVIGVSSSAVSSVLAAFDEKKNVFYNLYDPFNHNDNVASSEFVKFIYVLLKF